VQTSFSALLIYTDSIKKFPLQKFPTIPIYETQIIKYSDWLEFKYFKTLKICFQKRKKEKKTRRSLLMKKTVEVERLGIDVDFSAVSTAWILLPNHQIQ